MYVVFIKFPLVSFLSSLGISAIALKNWQRNKWQVCAGVGGLAKYWKFSEKNVFLIILNRDPS